MNFAAGSLEENVQYFRLHSSEMCPVSMLAFASHRRATLGVLDDRNMKVCRISPINSGRSGRVCTSERIRGVLLFKLASVKHTDADYPARGRPTSRFDRRNCLSLQVGLLCHQVKMIKKHLLSQGLPIPKTKSTLSQDES